MESLKKYISKRNFNITKEPKGNAKLHNLHHSFVIQLHFASKKHYDLRLEYRGVLLSWAIPKGPSYNPRDKRLAVQVENHPLEYQYFEGVIPQGEYGGGSVIIFDKGIYNIEESSMKKSLEKGKIKIQFFGERIKGSWLLLKKDEKNWLFIKIKDKYCKQSCGIKKYTKSVVSNLSNKEMEEKYGKN